MNINSVDNRQLIVNKKIFIFMFSVIIFLTGCARQRYHTSKFKEDGFRETRALSQANFNPNFLWPLRGEVVGRFGAEQDLVSLKGLVIESKTSDRVFAARNGKVVLVDQNLKGYGKTIILEHADEFSTVYARNAEVLVSPGQWVRQGDWIARAGKGSRSAFSRLYFELRKNLKALDPLPYLKN